MEVKHHDQRHRLAFNNLSEHVLDVGISVKADRFILLGLCTNVNCTLPFS